METGRMLFAKFLKGEPLSRIPFVPLVRGLPARVDGTPFEALVSDPTLWANSLLKTAELFGWDGVVTWFPFGLMSEACGCSITWENDRPVVLPVSGDLHQQPQESRRVKDAVDVMARVFQISRSERASVIAMPGPFTMAGRLFGPEEGPRHIAQVKQLVAQVAEAFCQTRPDALILVERRHFALSEIGSAQRRVYNTLKNILSYYDVRAGLYVQGYRTDNLKAFAALDMEIYVLGPSVDGSLPPVRGLWELGANALGVGLSLPLGDLEKTRDIIREGLELYRQRAQGGLFFTSLGPVTRDINLEEMHQLINELRQVCVESAKKET